MGQYTSDGYKLGYSAEQIEAAIHQINNRGKYRCIGIIPPNRILPTGGDLKPNDVIVDFYKGSPDGKLYYIYYMWDGATWITLATKPKFVNWPDGNHPPLDKWYPDTDFDNYFDPKWPHNTTDEGE